MAKKRRKPKSRPRARTAQGAPQTASTPGVATKPPRQAPASAEASRSERAERKEMARHERDIARRRVARQRSTRRAVTIVGVMAVAGVAGYLILRTAAPGSLSAEALEIGRAAGCSDVQTPAASAPGGQHLAAGESANYTEQPASSGPHAPAPLPAEPRVFTAPINEEAAVHNLEHGYILLYYRAEDPEALPDDVVTRLSEIAGSQDKVFVAPHPGLEQGTSLAMVAWNKVWKCPSTVEVSDAATMANSFIAAYKGTSNAPEGNVP